MDSILNLLTRPQAWEEFLAYRLRKGRFTWREFVRADSFVEEEGYLDVAGRVESGGFLSIPKKQVVNKMGSGKKRIVYSFPENETEYLKALAHLLYRYDSLFSSGCYAFRRGRKASDAIFDIRRALRGKRMWAYKLDIHDYFNSIPIPTLLPILRDVFAEDLPLYHFFERMLTDDRSLEDGKIVHERKGIMAGTPTAPFLADIYLREVDRYFEDRSILYARYSDDIILFSEERDSIEQHRGTLLSFLDKYQLEVNPDKERLYSPDEPFEYLGFRCLGNSVDVSSASIRKIKGKISRKARALLRWKDKKGIDSQRAMRALVAFCNQKFFESEDPDAPSWSRWFFPVINEIEGLKEIDHYIQQQIRFLGTGRHNKANYRIRYDTLKDLGYRSLVHEYYLFKEKASEKPFPDESDK